MLSKRILVISGLAFLTIAIVSALDLVRPFVYLRLCNLYRDGLSRGGRTTAANSELVFLAIDAASVNLDESDIEDLFNLGGDDSKAERGRLGKGVHGRTGTGSCGSLPNFRALCGACVSSCRADRLPEPRVGENLRPGSSAGAVQSGHRKGEK